MFIQHDRFEVIKINREFSLLIAVFSVQVKESKKNENFFLKRMAR